MEEQRDKLLELKQAGQVIIGVSTGDALLESVTRENCNFIMVPTGRQFQHAIMFAPHVNQTIIDCFSKAIDENRYLITKSLEDIRKHQTSMYDQCRHNMRQLHSRKVGSPVKLLKISGTLTIYAGGCALALVLFCIELAIKLASTSQSYNVNMNI